ncbi:CopG family transcriptional regulator [Demequina pelophila]|uniref:CopG family transcriptional regulator n=1 Tax=Demequina pelophila TaxID=1638984 RepID=UPI000781AB12|nr:CopG family transcriptional regulator [Demequina pelophila]
MAMTLRLTEAQDQTLTALAESQGVSKQEAVTRAIEETAARHLHGDRVNASSAKMRARYAGLLDRLGQ